MVVTRITVNKVKGDRMAKYTIGIDYGTQSGRAVLVSVETGEEVADHVTFYAHGVMDEYLPDGTTALPNDWALQHPLDYIDVLKESVPAVIKKADIPKENIIGLAIDFTACTMLAIDEQLQPLCFNPLYERNPHSWVKLWKHHAAQHEANQLNIIAAERNEKFLQRYGGKISSEWMIAKIWQTLSEAPDIYDNTYLFVEAADWVTAQLTGKLMRNSCTAGYKAIWHKGDGYPSPSFFSALDTRLTNLISTKLKGDIHPLGTLAGYLTEEMAEILGLDTSTAVAVGNVDAHVAVPAVGVTSSGKMVMSMGTSICHMLLHQEEKLVPGICGVVEDGIIPGFYGYEAGQSAVGDIFEWFIKKAVPQHYFEEAEKDALDIHSYLEQLATVYKPGQTGLLALDWWNGNRTVLTDTDLSGLLIGFSLRTKAEEIYRALLESTAFGTRKIIDTFRDSGIPIHAIYACGGLPRKNRLLMQIFADVCNMPIYLADSVHTPAVGAAMFAAVATGKERGGYHSINEAAQNMARVQTKPIVPIEENVVVYDRIYYEYSKLHDYFGRGKNDVMKVLKKLKN